MKWSKNSELTNRLTTPLAITGLLVQLLKDHFSINSEQFKYDTDPVESKVVIDVSQKWTPENCDRYPGIYVKRGVWSQDTNTRTMGNYMNFFSSPKGFSSRVPVVVQYSLLCVGNIPGEVEVLVNEVGGFFTVFGELIRSAYSFDSFLVAQITPTAVYEPKEDLRLAQVDLIIKASFVWELQLESPILQKYKIIKETT